MGYQDDIFGSSELTNEVKEEILGVKQVPNQLDTEGKR